MNGTGLLEWVKGDLALRTGTDGSNEKALKDRKDDCFYQTYRMPSLHSCFPPKENLLPKKEKRKPDVYEIP